MTRITSVWDSTAAVLSGRIGVLATVALLAFFLPSVAQAAVESFAGKSAGAAALRAAIMLLTMIASLWGTLAIIGVAGDQARARASAAATARLPAALLLLLVLVAASILLALPAIAAMWAGGYDFAAAFAQAGSARQPPLPLGVNVFLFFYGLVITLAALAFYARMFPLLAVVLHERRRIGAFGRSWRLTSGMTWRLIGVALLFVGVFLVAALAVQSVVFIVALLLLGAEGNSVAEFIAAVAAAVVGAMFSTVVAVFGARLWAALVARESVPGRMAESPSAPAP